MYIDGELIAEYGNTFVEATPGVKAADNWGGGARIGQDVDDSWQFNGLIDDFCLFTRALSAAEVIQLMQGRSSPIAFNPTPADGSVIGDTWVNLSWYPGDKAVSHDVYFSDNFNDVNDGTGDAFVGDLPVSFEIFAGRWYVDFWIITKQKSVLIIPAHGSGCSRIDIVPILLEKCNRDGFSQAHSKIVKIKRIKTIKQ